MGQWATSLFDDCDTDQRSASMSAEGIVLGQTTITLRTGASVDGRLLAQAAVDLDGSTVVEPGG